MKRTEYTLKNTKISEPRNMTLTTQIMKGDGESRAKTISTV